jgi:hypothetical protein
MLKGSQERPSRFGGEKVEVVFAIRIGNEPAHARGIVLMVITDLYLGHDVLLLCVSGLKSDRCSLLADNSPRFSFLGMPGMVTSQSSFGSLAISSQ